ncbi:TetR/AcrR family transcriptional regulator [Pyruvatibacter sp.]|uniref:TetR/AcrR family transcriptional regulator n=1 Tax=Pyruvatibacter sp. TaxID=1981328 RepID=UPI003264D5B5
MARPRTFDTQDALAAIMGVFWRNGFEGTSLQDIEASTGLNKQSLYRIYPDKRAMYLAALRHYDQTEIARAGDILSGSGSARDKFLRLFKDVLAEADNDGPRRGCFLCNASIDEAQLDTDARDFISSAMRRIEQKFQDTLAGDAPYNKDAKLRKATATKLLSFYFGLRVLIKARMPASGLRAGVREALENV